MNVGGAAYLVCWLYYKTYTNKHSAHNDFTPNCCAQTKSVGLCGDPKWIIKISISDWKIRDTKVRNRGIQMRIGHVIATQSSVECGSVSERI